MTDHPDVARLHAAHFGVLPILNPDGVDEALLFWRWRSDRRVLDAVAAWSDDYAVWVRLPSDRNWADPFVPTVRERVRPTSFAAAVRAVVREPRQLLRPPAGADADRFGHDDA